MAKKSATIAEAEHLIKQTIIPLAIAGYEVKYM